MEEDEGGNFVVRNYRGKLIPIIWFTYTGADGEVIDEEATHILVHRLELFVREHFFIMVTLSKLFVVKMSKRLKKGHSLIANH